MHSPSYRFTFLTPADDLTGGNRVVATYAEHLAKRGHSVLVVSNAPDRPGVRERLRALRRGVWLPLFPPPPAPGHVALSGVPHLTLDRPRAIRASDLPDADFVVATWWETAVWMDALPSRCGKKVHLIQGFETWLGTETQQAVHRALRLPNQKIAISAGLAKDIEQTLGPLGIGVVPNAVDLKRFDAPVRARKSPPTVGFIYAHSLIKGSDISREVIALVRRQIPDLRVIAFGADSPDETKPLPPETQYHLRPKQVDIPEIYRQCDAWLFCSRQDSFGLPILEAMACRTPVVAVPIGAAPDLLASGGGRLAKAHDPAELAHHMIDLINGPQPQWEKASEEAYHRAHQYGWEQATDLLLATLRGTT